MGFVKACFVAGAICVSSTSCVIVKTVDFDAVLNSSLGKTSEEVRWPSLENVLKKNREENLLAVQYSLTSTGHCRWIFLFDDKTKKIVGWRYPDADAKEWCSGLLTPGSH